MNEDRLKRIFASNLNRYLSFEKISQLDISKSLSVSTSTVSTWCTAQKMPRMDKIQALADLLGIQKSDLIEEKSAPTNEDGLSDIEKQLIQALKGLTPDQKLFLLAQIQLLGQSQGT